VHLSAYHAGGNVVIELADDGRGLDREKILAKAISRGLIESERGLSDSDIYNLIFAPGFSTAEQVTDVSGRGVGMDVVKRNIERVRGRIEISSEPGKGSVFSLRLPLTLAMTDGMLVRVGGERYIVPTISIQMSFRPTAEMLSTVVARGEMVLLRGDLIPIVRLHRLFDIEGAVTDPTAALLVVIGVGERRYALLVDELLAQQQVVAKSLGAGVGRVPGVSGGAILGDGRVGLILDPAQLAALLHQGGAVRSVA
jgi:two-component system chemotaxis sensor kinase CheA